MPQKKPAAYQKEQATLQCAAWNFVHFFAYYSNLMKFAEEVDTIASLE